MVLHEKKYFIIKWGLSALACLLFCAIPIQIASSQEKPNPQRPADAQTPGEPLIKLETELVQIDMVVTDKDGKLIKDLRREDFELYEDGKRQAITHFAVGTSTRPATWLQSRSVRATSTTGGSAVSESAPAEIASGRFIVLAIDDYHLEPGNLMFTKQALKNFVRDQMVAGDQIALVTTSGTLGMYQQFSSQKRILERAIDRLTVQNRTTDTIFDVPRITDYQAEMIDRGDPDALELAVQEILRSEADMSGGGGGGGGGGQGGGGRGGGGAQSSNSLDSTTPRGRAIERARSKARMLISMNANYTRATLETLNQVIRSLQPLTGRKMLVLFSDGFYLGGNHASQVFDIRRITDAATRSGVVIYSIDARGLIATPPGGDASQPAFSDGQLAGLRTRIENSSIDAKRDGINALAYDTGGFLVLNTNDLNLGMQKILADNETYYVLAYEPPESRRDGRFHKIEVRIADRPELKVRTRKGYFAPVNKPEKKTVIAEKRPEKISDKEPTDAEKAKETHIMTSMASLFPLREIPIEIVADYFDTPDRGSLAMISGFIEARNLDFQQIKGLQSGRLDLRVVIFDEKGKTIVNYNDQISLNLPAKTAENVRKFGLSYRKFVTLNPGFYHARVVIREESTGKIGSASNWIEVPDLKKKKLAISSVLLSLGDEQFPTSAAGNQPEQMTMNPTTAKRRFPRKRTIDFIIFTYNARASEKTPPDVVVQTQVYSGSKLVYASPLSKMVIAPDTDLQRIPYAARVSLQDFEPGEYELRVVAIDRTTKESAYRSVNFHVE